MIELIKTQQDGSRTYLIRHLDPVREQDGWQTDADGNLVLDESGEKIPIYKEVERDIHKPQRYTIAPKAGDAEGATKSQKDQALAEANADAEEFAAQVLANHEAGRPLNYIEPTAEQTLSEARNKAKRRVSKEASQLIIKRTGPPQRQLAQIVHGQKLSLRAIRGKATTEEEAELDALDALAEWTDAIRAEQARVLALIEQSDDPESVTADWPEVP